jgi:P pilus assembly chaperone PapD
MKVMPFIHSFAPVKGEKVIQYSLTNDGDRPVAFEIIIFRRNQNIKGEDILQKDEESFTIFPSQVIIPGHGTRNIRVKWIGNGDFEKNPRREQAFRVLFDQFHIDFKQKKPRKSGAALNIKLRMLASLYMTPKNARKSLTVTSVKEKMINGEKVAVIRMKNDGASRCSVGEINPELRLFGRKCFLGDIIGKGDRDCIIISGCEREFIVKEATVKARAISPVERKADGRGRSA